MTQQAKGSDGTFSMEKFCWELLRTSLIGSWCNGTTTDFGSVISSSSLEELTIRRETLNRDNMSALRFGKIAMLFKKGGRI